MRAGRCACETLFSGGSRWDSTDVRSTKKTHSGRGYRLIQRSGHHEPSPHVCKSIHREGQTCSVVRSTGDRGVGTDVVLEYPPCPAPMKATSQMPATCPKFHSGGAISRRANGADGDSGGVHGSCGSGRLVLAGGTVVQAQHCARLRCEEEVPLFCRCIRDWRQI